MLIVLLICATVVIISIVGGLIYMQKQNISQKNKELQQQKQLKEYEQNQINARNKADNIGKCQAIVAETTNPFDDATCN